MADAKRYWVHPHETEAPEQIGAWGWRIGSSWQEQTWQHEDEPISTLEYVRADRFYRLEALLAEAVQALEWVQFGCGPSGESAHERARDTLAKLKKESSI
jgi:hypothetical protein